MRDRLARLAGADRARELPDGYQRLGSVLLLRLPEALRELGPTIGELYREELEVETVLAFDGTTQGEFRRPNLRVLAGERTETVHQEEGIRWRLDARDVLFASGNRTERRRAGRLVRPGEVVGDLFAGIGYFTVPAARFGAPRVVHAVEKNPRSYQFLLQNLRENGVQDRIVPHLGDNREVDLPKGTFDRLFLGLLPSSLPFVARGLELLAPAGGTLHLHLVAPARGWREESLASAVRSVEEAGGRLLSGEARQVKPYGPSRAHVVVDARVRPRG